MFEPSLSRAADLLAKHSGGKITTALKTAIELGSIKYMEAEKAMTDEPHVPQSEQSVTVGSKDLLPPPKEAKNALDCFNCWR